MVGYPESFNSIGAIQQICEALSENPIKPVFPTFFLAQNVFFPTEIAFSITDRPSTINWAAIL